MYHFDVQQPVSKQLLWLLRIDPDYLVTYPSNLRALLERSAAESLKPTRLRDVSLMGEVVDPDLPALCRETWGVSPAATYSANETSVIATQCIGWARYHVQSESVLVEILDDDGRPCRQGQVGRIVVTDLHNFAMPLIRYAIGDFAEVGGPCPCGRGLPTLARILGRTRNMFVLPSGEKFWPTPLQPAVLKTMGSVRQIQIVQKTPTRLEVRLSVAEPLAHDAEQRLRQAIHSTLRHPFHIELAYVKEIPRSPSGKYEDCVSEIAT
jgi:phenylacetate-CoA ligase